MTKVINVGSYPVDLNDGRVLAPGDTATAKIDDPHNQVLINQGSILVVDSIREDKKS